MRMWNINPKLMCRKHLLGEHLEMHMFAGCLRKGISLDGYIRKGLVEINNISKRHDKLAVEMEKRSYQHNSPLEYYPTLNADCKINQAQSQKELMRRCGECRNRSNTKGR